MNLFGKQAGTQVPYVECSKPKQLPDQAAACQEAKIRAYPTWVLPMGSAGESSRSKHLATGADCSEMPRIQGFHTRNLRGDLLGVTAAVVALPLALAFGNAALGQGGAIYGLYGAIVAGF